MNLVTANELRPVFRGWLAGAEPARERPRHALGAHPHVSVPLGLLDLAPARAAGHGLSKVTLFPVKCPLPQSDTFFFSAKHPRISGRFAEGAFYLAPHPTR